MGCEVCRQKEPEATFLFQKIETEDNEKQNMNSTERKEDYEKFLSIFDNNIQAFGKYFEQDFNTLIPQKIIEYVKSNPLRINPELLKDLDTYKIKPIEFQNGNVYEGGWNRELKLEGKGKYFLKKDRVFAEGVWHDGNLIFARVFTANEDDFDIYEGEIKNSNYNGKGKLILPDGQIYEGDFVNGEKTGYCKIIFPDETVYEGQIDNGQINGKGKMIWKNGYEYEGDFDKNKLSGNGILKSPKGDVYNGEFSDNLFNGKGIYTYNNGDSYEGQFLYGAKKGKGIYKCLNYYEYEGDWDNNLPCGNGKLSTWDKNGIIKSRWRNGQIMEEPIYEKGNETDFMQINLNIIPNEGMIYITDLSNLEISSNQSTQFKLGTLPSFLDD